MSIIKSNMTAPPPPSGGALSSISEMNSLRFDGSSYLSKTFGQTSSDLTKWTFSCWVKLNKLVESPLFCAGSADGNENVFFSPRSAGYIGARWGSQPSQGDLTPSVSIRDYSAWYHLVITWDTQQSTADARLKYTLNKNWLRIGTNGVTHYSDHNKYPAQNVNSTRINHGIEHNIGRFIRTNGKANFYLANIHFIDGQALDANAFGAEISGVWVPKAYDPATSGAYGTNGFHLDFAASNMDWTNSKVLDASGNGNDWNLN